MIQRFSVSWKSVETRPETPLSGIRLTHRGNLWLLAAAARLESMCAREVGGSVHCGLGQAVSSSIDEPLSWNRSRKDDQVSSWGSLF